MQDKVDVDEILTERNILRKNKVILVGGGGLVCRVGDY